MHRYEMEKCKIIIEFYCETAFVHTIIFLVYTWFFIV